MRDAVNPPGAVAEKLPGWAYMLGTVPPPPSPRQDYQGTFIREGRLAVSVGLKGALGAGRRMVLDDEVWRRVEKTLGSVWGLRASPCGSIYVVGKRKASAGPGLPATPVLSRWIAKATASEVVGYKDADPLNLMAGNLVTVDRRVWMRALGTPGAA